MMIEHWMTTGLLGANASFQRAAREYAEEYAAMTVAAFGAELDLPPRAADKSQDCAPVAWLTESGRMCLQDGDGPVRVMPAMAEDVGFTVPLYDRHTVADLVRTARALALERAELRHEVMRALVAWDGTVLPKAHDGLMQERMECLREALGPNGVLSGARTGLDGA